MNTAQLFGCRMLHLGPYRYICFSIHGLVLQAFGRLILPVCSSRALQWLVRRMEISSLMAPQLSPLQPIQQNSDLENAVNILRPRDITYGTEEQMQDLSFNFIGTKEYSACPIRSKAIMSTTISMTCRGDVILSLCSSIEATCINGGSYWSWRFQQKNLNLS